jgi:signal transduction histidine kinase
VRRVPIRMKLAGALAVPLAALIVVTGLEVVDAGRNVATVRDQTALAEVALGPASVLTALELERNAAGVYLLGMEGQFALEVEDPFEAIEQADAAVERFREVVESRGDDVVEAYAPAFEAMEGLDELRTELDTTPDDVRTLRNIDAVSTNFDGYTEVMATLAGTNRRVALAIDDPTLRQGTELIDLNSQQTNLVAILVRDMLLAQVGGDSPDGVTTSAEISRLARNLGQLRTNWSSMRAAGTGRYAPLVEDLVTSEQAEMFPQVVEESIDTGTVKIDDVMAYSTGDDAETLAYNVFSDEVERVVREEADNLEQAAQARQLWFLALAVLAVAIAGLVAWLVSRSITKPLRSLTRQATDMAERTLPDAVLDILETPLGDDVSVPSIDPVDITTRDEVADVAVALNTVQDTALELAVEQAVLRRNIADSFVNLGRRNQNLLGRQLDFITELETSEADPDTLANLFRLDHLATRMRRNAESLLVLAGIEPPRQWAAPVRLTDVIRAALGEVEDYQRVTVRGVEPATILGSAAADLAHLLAELIENALVFSPPDQTVDIRGRNRPDGYTLAIIDSGLGMPPNDITAANRRLAGAESFTIAPSKYLGHYVAGNLAARHNINVHLDNSPGNGITATIDIPPTLLTTDTDLAAPVTPPHGMPSLTTGAAATTTDQFANLHVPAPRNPTPTHAEVPPPPTLDTPAPVRMPAPEPVARTPEPPSRTPSGLVKRARRGPELAPQAGVIDSDLLASLSSVAGHLGPGRAHEAASEPPTESRAPSLTSERADITPRSWPAPGGGHPGGPGPIPGRRGPATGDNPPPPPPSTRGGHGSRPGEAARGPEGGHNPGVNGPTWGAERESAGQNPQGWPADPAAGASGGPDPMATPGGLARRVRGAQLPVNQPLGIRRNQVRPSGGAAGYRLDDRDSANSQTLGQSNRNGHATGHTNVSHHDESSAARSVYGFLTSFTEGVQRGLEEARRDPNTPKESS